MAAARQGHLAVVRWARSNGAAWDVCTSVEAAVGGHVHVLQWLRANGCEMGASTCAGAARSVTNPLVFAVSFASRGVLIVVIVYKEKTRNNPVQK